MGHGACAVGKTFLTATADPRFMEGSHSSSNPAKMPTAWVIVFLNTVKWSGRWLWTGYPDLIATLSSVSIAPAAFRKNNRPWLMGAILQGLRGFDGCPWDLSPDFGFLFSPRIPNVINNETVATQLFYNRVAACWSLRITILNMYRPWDHSHNALDVSGVTFHNQR